MADGMCDWDADGPHARNHILTTLDPFSTIELCDEHYGPGMIPLLGAELGVDPNRFYGAVEKFLKAEGKRADKELADAQAAAAAEGSEEPAADGDGEGQGQHHEPVMDEDPVTGDMVPLDDAS